MTDNSSPAPTFPKTIWLDALPEKPEGWTQRMELHLNFGREGGAMQYALYDEQSRKIKGIGYGYDTRKGGGRGFYLLNDEQKGWLTWAQLREAYASWRQKSPAVTP